MQWVTATFCYVLTCKEHACSYISFILNLSGTLVIATSFNTDAILVQAFMQ